MNLTPEQTEELMKWLRESHDFVVSQGPQLANEIVGHGIYTNVFSAIIGGVFFLLGIIGFIVGLKLFESTNDDVVMFSGFLIIASTLSAIGGLGTLVTDIYHVVMIYNFPKVYLLQFLT
jgi:hypothetical protein